MRAGLNVCTSVAQRAPIVLYSGCMLGILAWLVTTVMKLQRQTQMLEQTIAASIERSGRRARPAKRPRRAESPAADAADESRPVAATATRSSGADTEEASVVEEAVVEVDDSTQSVADDAEADDDDEDDEAPP